MWCEQDVHSHLVIYGENGSIQNFQLLDVVLPHFNKRDLKLCVHIYASLLSSAGGSDCEVQLHEHFAGRLVVTDIDDAFQALFRVNAEQHICFLTQFMNCDDPNFRNV